MNQGRTGHGWFRRRWEGQEMFRFLVVGMWNTLFGYLCFASLFLLLRGRFHYLVILMVAHIVAVTNSFVGHRYFTFKAQGHLMLDFMRFNLTYLGALGYALVCLPMLIEICGLHPLVGQAAVSTLGMLLSYLLHKHLSFRRFSKSSEDLIHRAPGID